MANVMDGTRTGRRKRVSSNDFPVKSILAKTDAGKIEIKKEKMTVVSEYRKELVRFLIREELSCTR